MDRGGFLSFFPCNGLPLAIVFPRAALISSAFMRNFSPPYIPPPVTFMIPTLPRAPPSLDSFCFARSSFLFRYSCSDPTSLIYLDCVLVCHQSYLSFSVCLFPLTAFRPPLFCLPLITSFDHIFFSYVVFCCLVFLLALLVLSAVSINRDYSSVMLQIVAPIASVRSSWRRFSFSFLPLFIAIFAQSSPLLLRSCTSNYLAFLCPFPFALVPCSLPLSCISFQVSLCDALPRLPTCDRFCFPGHGFHFLT